ncbi:hypothetical protein F3K34_43910 [Streptomyces sp. LBUM 1486]|uniref:hypothetical protein n=3 Tax=Streptomyces scabiei TaxID=1930 RepID=UPI001B320CD2|nr:hypothetical protein [Streptomyces sp. LBUM 1486]MBP5918734.1 hypothetical protein [Streptomyces sp. LBUM 1486]
MTSNESDVHDLTDEELLPLMVAAEHRTRQRRRGLKLLLYPEPPCVLCGAIPNEQSVDQPLPESMLQRLVVNEPCGHRMRYSLEATERLVPQALALVDAEENRPAGTRCSEDDGFCPAHGYHRHAPEREQYASSVHAAVSRVTGIPDGVTAAVLEVRDRELETLRAEVAAARKFAGEMRDFCSPHNVAVDYADRLVEAMDRARKGALR